MRFSKKILNSSVRDRPSAGRGLARASLPCRRCYHRFVRDTLQVLLQLRSEGRLVRFAIGGAVAASFYIEAVATEELDVFALLGPQV